MQSDNLPNHAPAARRSIVDTIITTIVFLLLMLHLVIGTGEMIHGRLLNIGEQMFGDPAAGVQYSFLRADPKKPDCDRNPDIEAQVQAKMSEKSNDDFADLFEDKKDPAVIRQSLLAAQQLCNERYVSYDQLNARITPKLRAFRGFEQAFFQAFNWGNTFRPALLVLMVSLAAIVTTRRQHHIALRPPHSHTDFKVYNFNMALAAGLILMSIWAFFGYQGRSGIPMDKILIFVYIMWSVLFGFIVLYSLYRLLKPSADETPGGSVGKAFLSVPLFAFMAIISGIFFLSHDYAQGIAVHMGRLSEFASQFLSLALYIWVGMLLKQTRLVQYLIGMLKPWNFSPETLTWFLMIGAAYFTAYTGASGIFVIAAGAIIYREVMAAGGRPQYALAATAMSGSLGVVLSPCLLIVVIAAMNDEVGTAELYSHGFWVFLLTSTLFLLISLMMAKEKFRIASPATALPGIVQAAIRLIPFILIAVGVWAFYAYPLNTRMDETNADRILPMIMLGFVLLDFKLRKPGSKLGQKLGIAPDEVPVASSPQQPAPRRTLWSWLWNATDETIGHIGSLIVLMALSVSIGGVIEDSGIMTSLPQTISSVYVAVTMLLLLMIVVGMLMDPFGAVIVITATVAPVAYQYGIHPVHFWLIVLAAFELGYLTPPVALNQLLTRQVVGEKAIHDADMAVQGRSFFWRYERWILPLIVMAIALLIIAYGPLLLGQMGGSLGGKFGWY